jgi:NodT family efflux transporter outer membrane factor (OMF) lipoprotein
MLNKAHLLFFITLMAFCLTACMVGPNFKPPVTLDINKSYTECPEPRKTVQTPKTGQAGKAQYLLIGRDIPAEWWHVFHSCDLDALIDIGIANSPNIGAAKAALWKAEALLQAQVASSMYPNITGLINVNRQRFTFSQFGVGNNPASPLSSTTFNLFNSQLNVSYVLDVWGGQRRQIENLCAQVDYQKYLLEGAYLTLASNIATTAITIASIHALIDATEELIDIQEKLVTLTQQRFQIGAASSADVLSQQTLLAQLQASLPPLDKSLAQTKHALSVLIGNYPSENQLPDFDLKCLHLPANLPLSLPSKLVHHRPDIRASEALLHAASADIGVAIANRLPNIKLTGYYGNVSDRLNRLFIQQANVWEYGVQLTQPLFDAGALKAKQQAAVAAYQEAAAQYGQTVLTAFQNVADTLRAIEHDARTFKANTKAEIAAKQLLSLSTQQYHLGGVNYLQLLNAQQQYLQAKLNRIQSQTLRYTDTVALYQALGGGWWNRC